jgi:hypothetical protein
LRAVCPRRVLQEQRNTGPCLLEVDAMIPTLEFEVDIAARGGIEARHQLAASRKRSTSRRTAG